MPNLLPGYSKVRLTDVDVLLNPQSEIVGFMDGEGRPALIPSISTHPLTGGVRNMQGPVRAFYPSLTTPPNVSGFERELNFTLPGQNTSAGVTICHQRPALGAYSALRVHYCNYDTSPWTITLSKCAASPTHENDGSALSWATMTYAGTNSAAVPAGSGASSDAVPAFLSSDVIYQRSVDRTDDPSKLRLHQFRTYAAGTQNTLLLASVADIQNINADAIKSGGRQYASRSPVGDLVTTTGTGGQPLAASNPFQHPALVEYFYDSPCRTLAFVGDSLTQGRNSTANGVEVNNMGFPMLLTNSIQGGGFIFTQMNFANSSQTYAATMRVAKSLLATFKPDFLFAFAWSPNTGAASDAVMFDCRARLLETAALAARNGTRLVVLTSGPVNAYNAASDARIKAQNVWARTIAAGGAFDLVDVAAVVQNPANAGQILPAYDCGDGLHYSDAGYAAIAASIKASGVIR